MTTTAKDAMGSIGVEVRPPAHAVATAEPEKPAGPGPAASRTVWRLRTAAVCAMLTCLAFLQSPGLTAADSKTDLVTNPLRWLISSLHIWYPEGTFGQLQNQAYGYLWPMGPFFVAGDLLDVPPWVIQRLWWALLMCVACVGVVMLAERLGIGTPATRLIAGVAFALSPRLLSEMGPISVEAWPSAVAPWVLVPLAALRGGQVRDGEVRGGMRVRRAVALSAVAVACAGGANATAVLAVMPLAALFLATLPGLRFRWFVIGAWCLAVLAATAWWVVPLLLLGRFSPPFMDYIETSDVTTGVTDLVSVIRGTSHWLGYYFDGQGPAWAAAWRLATESRLVIATLVVAGLGIAGLARRGMPHRRFLVTGLLAGLALVGVGHVGQVDGLFADAQREFLNGAGAPLRNVHKFDVVVRLPLILGLAHLLGAFQRSAAFAGPSWHIARRRFAAVTAAALAAIAVAATPAIAGGLPNRGDYAGVPGYWPEAATWLDKHLERDSVLVVPAARFPRYTWGSPTDEIAQSLVDGGWGVRNAIPLTPAATIRLLDSVESVLANGAGSAGLADLLARSGVRYLLVRSDLNYGASGSTRPMLVRQALDRSPGLRPVAAFGPIVGDSKLFGSYVDESMDVPVRALEVFAVERPVDRVVAYDASAVTTVVGGPESLLELAAAGQLPNAPTVLAGDLRGAAVPGPVAVTDGLRRREVAFGLPKDGASSTMARDDEPRLGAPAADFLPDWADGQATFVRYEGVRALYASSSWSDANPLSGSRPEHQPYAALDGDPNTSWRTAPGGSPNLQWLDLELDAPRVVSRVKLTVDQRADLWPTRVTLRAGPQAASADVVDGVAEIKLDGAFAVKRLHITIDQSVAVGFENGTLGVSELEIPDLRAARTLVVPAVPGSEGAPRSDATMSVVASAARSTPSCFFLDDQPRCAEGVARGSEDGDRIDRTVNLPAGGSYVPSLWVRPRPGPALNALIDRQLAATSGSGAATVTASSTRLPDPAARPSAVLDGDPATAWLPIAGDPGPWLRVAWPKRRTITGISLTSHPAVAGSRPSRVQVIGDGGTRTGTVEYNGEVRFDPPLETDDITVLFPGVVRANSYDPYVNRFEQLPVAIGELTVRSGDQNPRTDLDRRVSLPCGEGPSVRVGAATLKSAVDLTVRDLLQLREVKARVCTDQPAGVTLDAGESRLVSVAGAAVTPVRLALIPPGQSAMQSAIGAPARPVRVDSWGATRRLVYLEPRDSIRVLAVRENSNAGWRATVAGKPLTPIVVDGWQQGWVVPAGVGGDIVLTFPADVSYRTGLLAGAGLLGIVALLAFTPGRRVGPRRPRIGERPRWVLPALVGGAALLVVGGFWAAIIAALGLAVIAGFRFLPVHLSGHDRRRFTLGLTAVRWWLPIGCFALAGWLSMHHAAPHAAAGPQLAALATVIVLWLSVATRGRWPARRAPSRRIGRSST